MDPDFEWRTRAEKLLVVAYWWKEQEGKCCICHEPMEPYHRDAGKNPNAASIEHLVPKRDKGPNTVGNVRLAHRHCNNRLGGQWAENEWRKLVEAGLAPKPKRARRRPAYVFDPRHVQPPATGQPFVALDKKLVSLPRGATLLPTYKGHAGNVARIPKPKMTALETARCAKKEFVVRNFIAGQGEVGMAKDVRSMTRPQLRKEMLSLRQQFADMKADPEFEGHGGSPCEWMDERADEIRTELRSRSRWRQ